MKYIYKNNNIPTHFVKTDKFKTNTISIRFASPIDRTRITNRVLLPSVLYSGSTKFDSKRKINLFMEKKYDSSVSFSMSKLGLSSVITASISFVSDSYLKKPILDDMMDFLNEIIFNPLIVDGEFRKSSVDEEKRLLTEYFESIKDDKAEYAIREMKKVMYGEEDYGISPIGYIEDLPKVDGLSLYEEYQRMISSDSVEVILTGDFENTDFVNKLPLHTNYPISIIDTPIPVKPLRQITETMKVNQAKLNLGFRSTITHDNILYFPMVLANSILGAAPNNMLFQTIREKHALCYYVSSSYIPFNGAIYIYSGVNDKNITKTTDLILEQVELLKAGDFENDLMINAKKVLVNDLLESTDRQSAIGGRVYVYNQVGKVFDLDDMIMQINKVTKEEIIEAANTIELELMYALSNKEDVWKK